jgi:hypothetical protein
VERATKLPLPVLITIILWTFFEPPAVFKDELSGDERSIVIILPPGLCPGPGSDAISGADSFVQLVSTEGITTKAVLPSKTLWIKSLLFMLLLVIFCTTILTTRITDCLGKLIKVEFTVIMNKCYDGVTAQRVNDT